MALRNNSGPRMVRNMRAMILRSRLSDQEVRTIRGMIVALVKNKYRGERH